MARKDTPAIESDNLATRIRRRFEPLVGIDLELPLRDPMSELPDFGWKDHDEDIVETPRAGFARLFRENTEPDDPATRA